MTTGTAGAHVEDNTTNEETTAPNEETNLGAHFSETNQATSHTPRTVEEILGAHDIDDPFCWWVEFGDVQYRGKTS